MRPSLGLGLVVLVGISLAACGSDDNDGGGGGSAGTAGSGANGGAGGTGSTDPLVLVPPVKLAAEVAKDCPAAFQSAPANGQSSGYDSGGQSRGFWLQVPSDGATTPRPLMVVFNGTGEDGQQIYTRAHMSDFVARGFIVLAPDSAGNGTLWPVWDGLREPGHENDPNLDLDYFDSLVKCIAAHFPVDEKRIYVSGHSAGGIFTNHVLQRRSELLAGGIPASGIFDLTNPVPAPTLAQMAVLVTWGGDNDAWGGSANGVTVPEFNFVEQAALASQYYEKNVEQVYCKGKNLGHAWLGSANEWMIDYLLAHPKGLANNSPWTFVAPDASANHECSASAAQPPAGTTVSCASSSTAGCQSYCQLIGDCAAENATVEPVLGPQLETLGFSGPEHTDCGGCITKCESDAKAGGSVDAAVLGCFDTESKSAQCGAGIPGAMPFIDATNKCCKDQTASQVCGTLCAAIKTNSAAATLFSSCSAF